jgi:hypothetical protein
MMSVGLLFLAAAAAMAAPLAAGSASTHVVFSQAASLPARDWPDKSALILEEFDGGRIFIAQFASGRRDQLRMFLFVFLWLAWRRSLSKSKKKKKKKNLYFFFSFFFTDLFW